MMGKVIMSGIVPQVALPTPEGVILLRDIAEGTLVNINENGTPAVFYVAKHDYEPGLNGRGRTLLVRRHSPKSPSKWSESGNGYSGSLLDSWLNETYIAGLSEQVRKYIGTTKFYATPTAGSTTAPVEVMERSVFSLSGTEEGCVSEKINVEGTKLPTAGLYMAGVEAPGTWGGSVTNSRQWTRSPFNYTTLSQPSAYALVALKDGTFEGAAASSNNAVVMAVYRPCFTLPATAFFDEETLLLKEVP